MAGFSYPDWSDAGECHDYIDIHRENGRFIRSLMERRGIFTKLASFADAELIRLQLEKTTGSSAKRGVCCKSEPPMETRIEYTAELLRLLRGEREIPQLHALWPCT
jgi:hypothetical protein